MGGGGLARWSQEVSKVGEKVKKSVVGMLSKVG